MRVASCARVRQYDEIPKRYLGIEMESLRRRERKMRTASAFSRFAPRLAPRLAVGACVLTAGGATAALVSDCKADGSAPKKFYIFGHPVAMSPSPDIHNIGFEKNGFPQYSYERFDTEDAGELIRAIKSDGCGGGSVTIPHKETVLPYMSELTEAAKKIGAVNTITKLADGRLRGDNTDWVGIKNQLEAKAPPRAAGEPIVAILCGAGGTARAAAFALQKMGATRVLIFNRTFSRAQKLAAEFGFEAIDDLSALNRLDRIDFIVSTMPGSTSFQLPEAQQPVLQKFKPTCLEAAYIPRHTAFVTQALASGCRVVEGVEMLFEQGCAQCTLWTGMPAPRAAIAATLLNALFSTTSPHPAAAKMEPRSKPPDALTSELERA